MGGEDGGDVGSHVVSCVGGRDCQSYLLRKQRNAAIVSLLQWKTSDVSVTWSLKVVLYSPHLFPLQIFTSTLCA